MRPLLLFPLILVLAAGLVAAGTSALTDQELRDGRELYIAKCARCHKFYDPARYPDQEWREWMDKMNRKAKLKPGQKELLSRYLETIRAGARTNTNSKASAPR